VKYDSNENGLTHRIMDGHVGRDTRWMRATGG
jgi:hypothetical protein